MPTPGPSCRRRAPRAHSHLLEAAQAFVDLRRVFAAATHRIGDLGDVEVALGVAGTAMDGVELARAIALDGRAEAGQSLALVVADRDPVAERVRVMHADQLTYVKDVVAVAAEAVGLVDLVPDRLELAVAVEDLNAVVLAVGDEHVLVLIDDDIV